MKTEPSRQPQKLLPRLLSGGCTAALIILLGGAASQLLANDAAPGFQSQQFQKYQFENLLRAHSEGNWVDVTVSYESSLSQLDETAAGIVHRNENKTGIESNIAAEPPLHLSLSSEDISLALELNPSHVAAHIEYKDLTSGNAIAAQQIPELFTGKVSGNPDSWVRLARESNQGFSGQVKDAGQYYEFRADSDGVGTRMRKLPTLQKQLQELKQFPHAAEVHDYEIFPPASSNPLALATRASDKSLQQLRFEDGISVPGALRVAVVVDSLFNEHHNGRGVTRALSLINVVDGVYQDQFGVALVLDSVVAYTDPSTDPLRGDNRPVAAILDDFRSVRLQEPQLRPDLTLVHLFTGLRDPDGVLGLGWINTACRSDGYNISLSTPFTYDALLAAHEMAHNLGALHDDTTSCSVERSNIMWPRLSGQTAPVFSQCTLNSVRNGLAAACNLENIDLSVALESQPGPAGSGRQLVASVINNDPVRIAEQVRTLIRLPQGSRVFNIPSVCTVTLFAQNSGPEVVCEMGDIPALIGRSMDITLGLSTAPSPQWTRVDVASLVAADSQPTNNSAQLDLRLLGNTTFNDDDSVVVASASSATIGDSPVTLASQPVPGTQATQLFLPDGSSMIFNNTGSNQTGVSGGSAGAGKTGGETLAILLTLLLLRNRRQL